MFDDTGVDKEKKSNRKGRCGGYCYSDSDFDFDSASDSYSSFFIVIVFVIKNMTKESNRKGR